MLEFDDIQHILLARAGTHGAIRIPFVSQRLVRTRVWLSAIGEKAQSAAEVMTSVANDKRWHYASTDTFDA
jgi:hypothetical protein